MATEEEEEGGVREAAAASCWIHTVGYMWCEDSSEKLKWLIVKRLTAYSESIFTKPATRELTFSLRRTLALAEQSECDKLLFCAAQSLNTPYMLNELFSFS